MVQKGGGKEFTKRARKYSKSQTGLFSMKSGGLTPRHKVVRGQKKLTHISNISKASI
jgi:hypothetical protein